MDVWAIILFEILYAGGKNLWTQNEVFVIKKQCEADVQYIYWPWHCNMHNAVSYPFCIAAALGSYVSVIPA